ncbi:hypothetical protein C8A05DRAFT_36230 [Staphylotrichum tortipilum]|uniref:Bul1 C-terminal domain-containing protein n=1 Tax=Staphylotrichum tortipilum TaxID=2831512 RepID=A0AAN6RRI0_9PEZI|nr:hypothetical protein C8A05DRAFT_36230 [Staphylotrichum longicolle]
MERWVVSSASSTCTPIEHPQHSRKMSGYPRSDIRVNLRDHYTSKVYTSSSPIVGDVTITTKREVRFDSIQILLLGQTRTTFEGMSVPQEVTHTFLKMLMPVPDDVYPIPRVLQPGQTYTIPFNFVVPNQLTINACNHDRLSDQLQDHHVLLPPSVGGWERDDMAPRMAQIEYAIKARVIRDEPSGRKTRIMEASQPIQILPATPEEPPLSITENDHLYRMRKTKTLRKNLLSTKLGRITASATQPSPAILSPDGRRVMAHPLAQITLTFDPESPRILPPTVTSVSSKLTAHTYFSSGTISSFPNLGEWNAPYTPDRRGQFFTSVPLPTTTLSEQPAWTPSPPAVTARRDSGYGSDSSPPPSPRSHRQSLDCGAAGQQHTTTLTIPLSLPTDKKTLIPTFHSCIASRVYTVQLTLALASRGGSVNNVTLTVPLQIAVDGTSVVGAEEVVGGLVGGALPPSFEEAAADEHLRPRLLRVLGSEGVERERESWVGGPGVGIGEGLLPGYGEGGYRRRVD